jgi:hypothetical protein
VSRVAANSRGPANSPSDTLPRKDFDKFGETERSSKFESRLAAVENALKKVDEVTETTRKLAETMVILVSEINKLKGIWGFLCAIYTIPSLLGQSSGPRDTPSNS